MTHDHRHDRDPDPDYDRDHGHDHDARRDDTRVVERQEYREEPRHYDPPPDRGPDRAEQVNVNASRGGGATYADAGPGPLYYAKRILSLLFGILAVLIGLRVLLLLLVANEANPVVDFIFDVTEPFVAPFRGMFQIDQVSPGGGSVLDIAAVVALIGWLLIYLLIMAILGIADRDRRTV